MQNRKSAKKCRLKKKAEFGYMRGDVMKLQDENKNLKEKVLIFFPNLFYFSNLDQWDHHHALLENGGKHKPSAKTWAGPNATSDVPITDDARPASSY